MKKLFSLLLCILLLAGCAETYDGPTKTEYALTELATTYYSASDGSGETDRTTYAYDAFGNLVRSCIYDNGELVAEYKRSYDDRGNLTSLVTWDHTGLIAFPRAHASYTYDENGRLLTVTHRNGIGIKTGSDTYTYDDEAGTVAWDGTYDTQTKWLTEAGAPLRTVTHSEVGGGDLETLYEYDDLGRNTKVISSQNGTVFSTVEFRYDSQDRIVEEIICGTEGEVLTHNIHEYTENTITTYDRDGGKTVQTLHLDGRADKVEQFDSAGGLVMLTQYLYEQIQVPADREE